MTKLRYDMKENSNTTVDTTIAFNTAIKQVNPSTWSRIMNGSKSILVMIILPFIITACGEPRIDGSSEEAFEQSMERVTSSLSDEELDELGGAMMVIAFETLNFEQLFSMNPDETDSWDSDMFTNLMADLDGMTVSDIHRKADEIQDARDERERRQAIDEIRELEARKAEAEQARAGLAGFEVNRSRFYISEDGFISEPVIDITVKNNTEHAVSRAYFRGTYATPGRQIPWLVETFNYSISGGLEPGEEQRWRLAPNMFGPWGNLEQRDDAVLTVEVIRIDGPDEEPLYDARGLDEFDQRRLERLRESVE